MRVSLNDIEYGHYAVKPLGFWSVLGMLLLISFVEIIALLMMIPVGTIVGEDSLLFLVIAEVMTKGLVLWMLIRFYEEKEQKLVLSELMEDAFFRDEDYVEDVFEPNMFPRKLFMGVVTFSIIGFRFFYDNSLSYVLTQRIEISEELVEAFDQLFTWPLFAIFSVVIIAPFYEELVFRKFVLGGLLKRLSPFWSILISSFFFGLIHLNWLQGINAFLLGIILGWVYYKTKSIKLCMFGHFVNNMYAMSLGIVQEEFLSEPIYIINALLCLVGALIILYANGRFNRLVEEYIG